MKAVLRSVKPYWLYLILTRKKTVEIGKSCPQAKDWNKVVELYCSKDMRSFNRIPEEDKKWMRKYLGKVACRFVCDWISEYESNFSSACDGEIREVFYDPDDNERIAPIIAEVGDKCGFMWRACMSWKELRSYMGDAPKTFYAWHISQLKIYNKPKELNEFVRPCSYKGICYSCERFMPNGSGDRNFRFCNTKITRPPESWCYVQELEERK